MGTQKQGSRKKAVLLPVALLLASLNLTVTLGMLAQADTLDDYYGRGAREVVAAKDAEGFDTAYYPQLYETSAEALQAAYKVSRQLSDEGIVLLKNDGVLPLAAGAAISPFGLRYSLPFYSVDGSASVQTAVDYVTTPQKGLHDAFENVNAALEKAMALTYVTHNGLADNPHVVFATPVAAHHPSHLIYEFDVSIYAGLEASCTGTTGVVFIGRQTGEKLDAHTDLYDDGTEHMLAITTAEHALLAFAKANCESVVVVVECSAPMQLAELADDAGINAIVWVGGAGSTGFASLGGILVGSTTPSGKTPDIYPASLKADPAFANFDDGSNSFVYTNATTTSVTNYSWEENQNTPFHEYEEGVYIGYKYYETAHDIGALADYYNRADGVLYPFGYGLSYTSFSQDIVDFSDSGEDIAVTVRVTNTGQAYAGKETVQVYFTAPYTEFDIQYAIEKPTAVLVAFGKTGLLAPGAHEDITLTFAREEMASYCYTRRNPDGTQGCYVLEEGAYAITLRANSHDVLDAREVYVAETIWFDGSTVRQSEANAQTGTEIVAATNRFAQLTAYTTDEAVSGFTALSRQSWAATQPTAPTGQDRLASQTVSGWIAASDTTQFSYETDIALGSVTGSLVYRQSPPAAGEENGIVLAELRGKSYEDPLWDTLLDQLDYSETAQLQRCLFRAAYQTGGLTAIGKPETVEYDGPQGLTRPDQQGNNWLKNACSYPSVPVMAATWNQDLLYQFGYMVGQEALAQGVNGWYAPAMNTHRTAFGGRHAEYYSEDGVLAGYLAARVISGAGDAGVTCYVKHLVLADTEGHRDPHACTWLTEQALREIYLRPFEIAIKNATKTLRYSAGGQDETATTTLRAASAIMAGDCAVGTVWAAASYPLLTQLVRGEWGFEGLVISDMSLNSNDNRADLLLRAGCDLLMSDHDAIFVQDTTSATGQHALRTAIKNVCYAIVNSNVTQGVPPGSTIRYAISPWRLFLLVENVVVYAIAACLIAWSLLKSNPKKSPS